MNLTSNNALIRVNGAATAAQTEVDCTAVDMSEHDAITFLASIATAANTSVTTMTVQGRDTTTASWVALDASVAHTSGGSETGLLMALEVVKPMYRYVRAVITRQTANVALDCVVAIVSATGSLAVSQGTGVYTAVAVSPEPA